jgi:hypothetical protein
VGAFSGPKVEQNSLYNYHVCTSSGTFTPSFSGNIEVLVVAGGGGGGQDMGGGGGGGGVLTSTSYAVTAATGITVTVGAGGNGARARDVASERGGNGSNSVFGSLTAIGGGGGASFHDNSSYPAGNGGSGGGASGGAQSPSGGSGGAGGVGGGAAGTGTAGQGNNGSFGIWAWYPGGGGGAGAAGSTGPATGGAGILNIILGRDYYWGGGGGGSGYSGDGGNGGIGGGGGGAVGYTTGGAGLNPGEPGGGGRTGTWAHTPGGAGGQNTGGGGGGGAHYVYHNPGGNGGSGIVIIRYLKTLGTSTFSNAGPIQQSSLILSLDAANAGKGSSVEVLVVAGGAGGGSDMGGGGGAGGVIYNNAYSVNINVPISVTIGAGGAGAIGYANNPPAGASGSNSVFGKILAYGGGGGGSGHYYPPPYPGIQGQKGGSGGGLSPLWGRNALNFGGDGTVGQGNAGGATQRGDGEYKAGGGGGASQRGYSGGNTYSGNGGQGFLSAINGTSLYWGGGGGGAHYEGVGGNGGLGGGGGGSGWSGGTAGTGGAGLNAGGNGVNATTSSVGGAGGANTGGGGGGGGHQSVGGAGGSGIVIVRYYGSQQATGGTITSAGGYTIHTFTSSGTFTPTGWIGLKDTSSSGLTTTVVGATYDSANGGSYVFGASNKYIDLNTTNIISGTNPFTVEIFYNNTSGTGVLFGNYGTGYTSNTLWIFAGGVFMNSGFGYIPSYASRINGKHCICVSRDSSGYWNVYFDGNPEVVNTFNATAIATNQNYRIGADVNGAGEQFTGNIYSVKVYNKSLSATEVLQNFNALRGRFNI